MRPSKPLFTLAVFASLACGLACGGSADAKSRAASPAPAASPAVVAEVGDKKFTLAEVDARAMAANIKPYQDLFDARSATLDDMIDGYLLDEAAKEKGMTTADLLRQEVDEKVPPIADADVEAFFKQNQARLQGQTLEQVQGQIHAYLQGQSMATARNAYFTQLRARAGAIKLALDPPRVEVAIAANDPIQGPASAKVTIIEFSDFQCPYCARMGPTLEKIRQTYPEQVRIAFRDFPLPMHPQAVPAAEAAQCANEQGKFWEYHDKLFAGQHQLTPDDLKRYAGEVGLDVTRFGECFDSGRFRADVTRDQEDGQRAGVSGTPAFFVNGRFISGALPFEAFQKVIDDELRR